MIVIGSGAGGGTLAYRLAPAGKRVLLLERGGYLPRERDNRDSAAVFVKAKYPAPEFWYDKHGDEFQPGSTTSAQHCVLRDGVVPAAAGELRGSAAPRRGVPASAARPAHGGAGGDRRLRSAGSTRRPVRPAGGPPWPGRSRGPVRRASTRDRGREARSPERFRPADLGLDGPGPRTTASGGGGPFSVGSSGRALVPGLAQLAAVGDQGEHDDDVQGEISSDQTGYAGMYAEFSTALTMAATTPTVRPQMRPEKIAAPAAISRRPTTR